MEIVQPDSPASVQALILTKGMSTDGPTLTERLPEDKRADYATVMTANGLSPAAFDRMDPWLAAMSLTMTSLKIGRASCRERVCQYVQISVVAVSLNKQCSHTS